MKLLGFLSRWPVILTSFVIMNLAGFGFGYIQPMIGGELLDMIWNGNDAKSRLLEMTDAQKTTHIWATAVLDSIYPLAYGAFFIGLTTKLSRTKNKWLICYAVAAMVFDFIENIVQVIGLSSYPNILVLKNVVTPLKFISVGLAMAVALALILLAAYRKLSSPK